MSKWDILARSDIKRYSPTARPHSLTRSQGEEVKSGECLWGPATVYKGQCVRASEDDPFVFSFFFLLTEQIVLVSSFVCL